MKMRTYSAKHRVRNCWSSLIKPRIVSNRVWFGVPSRDSYVDSYDYTNIFGSVVAMSASISGLVFNGTTYNTTTTTITAQNITGKIITHDIGNGVNDALLNKCILEVMPDSSWSSYAYATYTDPQFIYELRSSVWIDGQGSNRLDLIAANMAVKGGLNPFCTVMQTPTDANGYAGDKVAFNGDDTYTGGTPSNAKGKPVESLVVAAPLNTKFRRATFTFISVRVVVIRSISIFYSEYQRKGFG